MKLAIKFFLKKNCLKEVKDLREEEDILLPFI